MKNISEIQMWILRGGFILLLLVVVVPPQTKVFTLHEHATTFDDIDDIIIASLHPNKGRASSVYRFVLLPKIVDGQTGTTRYSIETRSLATNVVVVVMLTLISLLFTAKPRPKVSTGKSDRQ